MRFRGDRPVEYRARRGARLSMASPKTQALRPYMNRAIVPETERGLIMTPRRVRTRGEECNDNFAHGLGAGHTRSRRLPDLAGGDEPAASGTPLTQPIYTPGYTLMGMLKGPRDDQVLLALAFSGGGKRSAAFAYGTLLGLRSMTVVEDSRSHPLLDDVDLYIIDGVRRQLPGNALWSCNRGRKLRDL